jgi:hypothetical protein
LALGACRVFCRLWPFSKGAVACWCLDGSLR